MSRGARSQDVMSVPFIPIKTLWLRSFVHFSVSNSSFRVMGCGYVCFKVNFLVN